MLRALGPALVASVALWACIAWSFVGLCTLTGHDHLHLCAREFGILLLGIDAAFIAAISWHDRNQSRRLDL